MTEFNNTPIVIGNMATTYGELRSNAVATRAETNATSLSNANQEIAAGAMKGLCTVVLSLLDVIQAQEEEIDRRRKQEYAESEES